MQPAPARVARGGNHKRRNAPRNQVPGISEISGQQADQEISPTESTIERASLLGCPSGAVEISGGEFNAVAGNHIRVEVNINGARQGSPVDSNADKPAIKKRKISQNENVELEADRHAPSGMIRAGMSNFLIFIGVFLTKVGSSHRSQTSSSKPAGECSSEVYYRCLASKKRGSPLWIPEPNMCLSIPYQRNGLMIGDAGLITEEGSYDSLYNVTLAPDHPLAINPDGLPENYTPLRLNPSDMREYPEFKQGSHLSSAFIKKSLHDGNPSVHIFEPSAAEGAILTLPDGSNSVDLGNTIKLRNYVSYHVEEMYKTAICKHGRVVKNGDLRVVTGYHKTTNWGMAAFSDLTGQGDSTLLKFRSQDRGGIGGTHRWEYTGTSAEVKTGPDTREVVKLRMGDPSQKDMKYENQTVFVRTLNTTLGEDVWNKLMSELGEIEFDDGSDTGHSHSSSSAHRPPSQGSSSSSSQHTFASGSQPSSGRSRCNRLSSSASNLKAHPSNGINKLLLKLSPNARMAITNDEDWISVLKEEDSILPTVDQLWERINESFVIREEYGVAFLVKSITPPKALPDSDSVPESGTSGIPIDSSREKTREKTKHKKKELEKTSTPRRKHPKLRHIRDEFFPYTSGRLRLPPNLSPTELPTMSTMSDGPEDRFIKEPPSEKDVLGNSPTYLLDTISAATASSSTQASSHTAWERDGNENRPLKLELLDFPNLSSADFVRSPESSDWAHFTQENNPSNRIHHSGYNAENPPPPYLADYRFPAKTPTLIPATREEIDQKKEEDEEVLDME